MRANKTLYFFIFGRIDRLAFVVKGKEAAEKAEQQSASQDRIKFKDVKIVVPKGGSVRVCILGQYEYARYIAHNLFGVINTRPCLAEIGEDCPDCRAVNEYVRKLSRDSAEYKETIQLRAQDRYLMAFGVIEPDHPMVGKVGIFDASKAQFIALKETIDKNSKADEDGEVPIQSYAFDFARSNAEKSTYSLQLVPKMSKKEAENFAKFDDYQIADDFYEKLLAPRTSEQMIDDLVKAGIGAHLFGGVKPVESGGEPDHGF